MFQNPWGVRCVEKPPNFDALALLLKSVPGNVGLLLDTWDWYVGGGTLDTLKGFGIDDIAYVRIADAPADADRETLSEEQRVLPSEDGAAGIETRASVVPIEEVFEPGSLPLGSAECHLQRGELVLGRLLLRPFQRQKLGQ